MSFGSMLYAVPARWYSPEQIPAEQSVKSMILEVLLVGPSSESGAHTRPSFQ